MPRTAALFIALLLVSVGASCGDDDDEEAGSARSREAYCALERQVDDEFERAFEALAEDASEADWEKAVVDLAKRIEENYIDDARAVVPEEIEEDFETLASSVEKAADGDVEALENPETDEAGERVDKFCYGPDGEPGTDDDP